MFVYFSAYYAEEQTIKKLKMRSLNAIPGQYCAVNYRNSWLRGEITSNICKDEYVQVINI